MALEPLFSDTNTFLEYSSRSEGADTYTGYITKVDPETQTMSVSFETSENDPLEPTTIPIHNYVTNLGDGLRIMPISGIGVISIYDAGMGEYHPLGYDLGRLGDLTDNIDGTKQDKAAFLLSRYLEEGELQLAGFFGSELYMSSDGSVLLRNQLGASIKLDNMLSRLEGQFANLKFEMDGVRVRAGNVIRPSAEDTTEDQYIVMMDDGTIKGMDQLEEDEDNWQTLKEFNVQVGTFPDYKNKYVDLEDPNLPLGVSPTGQLTIADAIIREDGEEHIAAGKRLKLFMKIGAGGLNITEDGDLYIMDYNNFSPTKFPTGTERSIRYKKSYFTIQETDDKDADFKTEIILSHESKAEIAIRNGFIEMKDQSGRSININEYGANITAPKAAITLNSKDIFLLPDGGGISLGATPTDGVVKVTHAAMLFDTHTHAGPVGPPLPTFQWQPLINVPNSPLVAQNLKVQ